MKSKLADESFAFAEKILDLGDRLITVHREYVISNQIMRSGTSIGANIREAQAAQSRADFIAKLYISLKESNETEYWLKLLRGRNFYLEEIDELLKVNTKLNILLRKSINTAKKSMVTKDKTIKELRKI